MNESNTLWSLPVIDDFILFEFHTHGTLRNHYNEFPELKQFACGGQ